MYCKYFPYCKSGYYRNILCKTNFLSCNIYNRLNKKEIYNPKAINISTLFNKTYDDYSKEFLNISIVRKFNLSVIQKIIMIYVGIGILDLLLPKFPFYSLSLTKMNENRFIIRMSIIIFTLILIINILFLI